MAAQKRGRPRRDPGYTSFDQIPISLDVQEAARLLQLSPDYVYAAVERGEIPALKAGPGGKIRINKYALFQAWGVRFEALTMQIPTAGDATATG